jgi:anti-sigma factor RsiW
MTDRPHLPCTEIIGFLADYLENELAPDRRLEFDRHLAVCPSCVAYLDSYRETILMARTSATALPVDEAPAELIEAILASRGGSGLVD